MKSMAEKQTVEKAPRMEIREISTQTIDELPFLESIMKVPQPIEKRRVSYGSRVRDALSILAAAAAPIAPQHLSAVLEEGQEAAMSPAQLRNPMCLTPAMRTTISTSTTPMAARDSIATNTTPAPLHDSASTCMTPLVRAAIATNTSPAQISHSSTMMTPLAREVIATNTSPAPACSASTMTTPRRVCDSATTTSPPAAAAALISLAADATPRTLKDHVESLAIGNELLREHHEQLASSLDRAREGEAEARLLATQGRAELQACIERAAGEMDELCAFLQQKDEQIAALALELQSRPEAGTLSTADTERFEEMCALVQTLRAQLEGAEEQVAQREREVKQASETARTEGARAEQLQRVNKMLQDDLRMSYGRHRTELQALQAQYRHDDYAARYAVVVGELQGVAQREAAMAEMVPKMAALGALEEDAARMLEETAAALVEAQQKMEEDKEKWLARVLEAESAREEMAARMKSCDEAMEEMDAVMGVKDEALAAAQEQLNSLSAMVAEMKCLLEAGEAAIAERNDLIAAASEESARLAARARGLEAELEESSERLVQMQADLDLAQEQLQQCEEDETQRAAASKGKLSAGEIEALKSIVAERDACIEQLTQQLEEQVRQHAELRDFVAEERVVRSEVFDDSEREVTALRQRCTAVQEVGLN